VAVVHLRRTVAAAGRSELDNADQETNHTAGRPAGTAAIAIMGQMKNKDGRPDPVAGGAAAAWIYIYQAPGGRRGEEK
jgi:hypothetical protein